VTDTDSEPIWVPSPERVLASRVDEFRLSLALIAGIDLADTRALHRFSCEQPGPFWRHFWRAAAIVGEPGGVDVRSPTFAATEFFPDGVVDFAATMLAGDPEQVVVIECDETGTTARWERGQLRQRVASMAATFRHAGVQPGDVIAAYATTSEPTLVAVLAAAACGAIATTVSAEFGPDAVIDRFSQVQPTVLVAVDGYRFAAKQHDVAGRVDEIVDSLESVRLLLTIGSDRKVTRPGGPSRPPLTSVSYHEAVADTSYPLVTHPVAFNDAGAILYSSGTTGPPKCIVHRSGGVLIKHLSEMILHCDIRPGDRVFFYTTPSWMMWNWLISGLAAGACVVLYSGSPLAPNPDQLLRMAASERVTYFGTSPSYLDGLRRAGVDPRDFDLVNVRTVAVTGAPLSPATARFAARFGADAHVLSKSGGTDLCGGLVTGDPTIPAWGGEIQAPAFGCDIAVVDDAGYDVAEGATGELVSRTPFPSMPIGFVGDTDGSKLRAAYYDRFPGCWHQADFVSRTSHGGYIVHGRSDTTLNANGVRIGTAEIYTQLERLPWIRGSAAVELQRESGSVVMLLVELDPDEGLDEGLGVERRNEITTMLRERCSPRHVPSLIEVVAELPRTRNGKLSEVAVADSVNLRPQRGTDALANPGCLDALRVLGSEFR
jgi:acetoacetyl-CoA synthetase